MDEHHEFERRLEEFNRRPYLTAAESMERKRLQKLKLAGRDRIEQILAKYRQKESACMKKMTGAQIFLKCLEREEVKHIFGYPGGVVLDIYDELTRRPQIKHILVRHEQAAAHAADGYARASGKVGVALVTSGPGATNTVTGIATAYMDSIPMVVFTGQVPTALIGNDAFQEADIVGITRPCTKHNYLVKDVNDWPRPSRRPSTSPAPGGPGRCWWTCPRTSSRPGPCPSSRTRSRSGATTPPTRPTPGR